MAEAERRTGGCHCGAVRYEAEADLDMVIECNCSHCSAKGFLLAFLPREQFRLVSGEERLTEYRFNKEVIAHQFCSACGTQPFAYGQRPDGAKTVALNLRCMDGVELADLSPRPFDGRKL